MKRILTLALLILSTSFPAHADTQATYAMVAQDILAGIDQAPLASIPAGGGYDAPRIAVTTLSADGDDNAKGEGMTNHLLHALQLHADGRYRFIALDTLDDLIVSIKREDLSADESRTRIQGLRANARADIIVSGSYWQEDNDTHVSYQALNPETGELLASSRAVYSQDQPRKTAPLVVKNTPYGRDAYRATVEEAERILSEKGYDPGPVDGYLTPETREALSEYQMDSALPVNGRLTRRTVDNLRRDTRELLL